jgi:CheY-like chemotaxis protein
MTRIDKRRLTILLVDDDEIDRKVVIRAFRQREAEAEIVEARDGIEALEILKDANNWQRLHSPFLILLDLSMPRMDGIEFMARLRRDKQLGSSLVIVLTTSRSDEDRVAAYDHHVAGYIVKSNRENEFNQVIDMIERYSRVIEFPKITLD